MKIEGKIILEDGSESEFYISDGGWSQWGADSARLYKTNNVLESITEHLSENGFFESEEN